MRADFASPLSFRFDAGAGGRSHCSSRPDRPPRCVSGRGGSSLGDESADHGRSRPVKHVDLISGCAGDVGPIATPPCANANDRSTPGPRVRRLRRWYRPFTASGSRPPLHRPASSDALRESSTGRKGYEPSMSTDRYQPDDLSSLVLLNRADVRVLTPETGARVAGRSRRLQEAVDGRVHPASRVEGPKAERRRRTRHPGRGPGAARPTPRATTAREKPPAVAGARYNELRTRLAMANLRLVAHVARRYRNRGLSISDLLQEGFCGLLKAIDRFDTVERDAAGVATPCGGSARPSSGRSRPAPIRSG